MSPPQEALVLIDALVEVAERARSLITPLQISPLPEALVEVAEQGKRLWLLVSDYVL